MRAFVGLVAIGGISFVSMGYAQAQNDGCAGIDDPSARLACYDQRSGRAALPATAPAPAPAPARPAAAPAPKRAAPDQDMLRRRTDFDSSIAAVTALRHGYYRLTLTDGTAYDTTVVAPPPAVGEAVHVRRSPFGTTFFDMAGRKPFTVKLPRAAR